MEKLIDKSVMLLFCFFLVLQTDQGVKPVIILYVGITFLAFSSLIQELNIKNCIWISFLVLCVIYPTFIYLLPILIYDCWHKQKWIVVAGILIAGFHWEYFIGDFTSLYLVALVLVAVLLSIRTTKLLDYMKTYHEARDYGVEKKIELQRKNKELMEKQDYEIHLATLQERTRIAREIHDNVGHMLTRSILQMGALSTIRKEEPLHTQLTDINENLNEAMNSIRESIHDLHNEAFDLENAVNEAVKGMRDSYKTEIHYDMSNDIDKKIKYCFIAVIKEAMSNIIKHSNGNEIRIILREHPGMYQMSIWDNGKIDDKKVREINNEEVGYGIGILNMKERVEQLQGNFSIKCENGFKIFISIPKEDRRFV